MQWSVGCLVLQPIYSEICNVSLLSDVFSWQINNENRTHSLLESTQVQGDDEVAAPMPSILHAIQQQEQQMEQLTHMESLASQRIEVGISRGEW